jgi:hypothetical protein
MATSGGPYVFDGVDAKEQLGESQYVSLRDKTTGKILIPRMWCDVDTDNDRGWFLVFTAFPRIRSPYVTSAYGNIPTVNDTDMNKLSDDNIRTVLKSGAKQTRAQWYQTSAEYGSVWADGSLTNNSTQWNEFEYPDNWNSAGSSSGQRFKRKRGTGGWSGWYTSAGGGCSGAVGGWSNYYNQSCVQSWFAGCEGGPAINHKCAGGVQDRANKILIWAA